MTEHDLALDVIPKTLFLRRYSLDVIPAPQFFHQWPAMDDG